MADIKANCEEIMKTIPDGVAVVAATKQRTVEEIKEAIDAGIGIIGENYVQEAVSKYDSVRGEVMLHMIGHLQRNKVKDAIKIFDCIQSVDSLRLAQEIDKQCAQIKKVMPVLIEVNIADEESKHGVNPDETLNLVRQIAIFPNLRIEGLMTMEPYSENPGDSRIYFKHMKQLFDDMKSHNIPNVDLRILSMGMSNSYEVAIEEGSNMVRIGTRLFGPRSY